MRILLAIAACSMLAIPARAEDAKPAAADQSLSLVVMDPLAEPLSCPCVAGYAQRKYEKLAEFLTERLGRKVNVTFAESFEKALAKESCKTIDIAIGKDSVVRADAVAQKLQVTPLARLTGQDGKTTQTGLILVRSQDTAQRIEDLRGYRILFGPKECDEKFTAPRRILAAAGIEVLPVDAAETTQSCSDGACKIIDWGDSQRAAAVISSYAAPLLEGCGTVKKGDLRVIGETSPVPFITAFATDRLEPGMHEKLAAALLDVGKSPDLKVALETLLGFVPIDDDYRALRKSIEKEAGKAAAGTAEKPAKSGDTSATNDAAPDPKTSSAWPGWRGPTRDGHVAWLPKTLPKEPDIAWRRPLQRPGLGGIAATEKFVIIGDRDISNMADEFRCYSAADGEVVWTVSYPAAGSLDYDNMPRATPLIDGPFVYLLGAFGHLTCADLETGITLWRINILEEFAGDPELVWGTCSSPLIVDGKLIVNPGGAAASVVALNPMTGKVIWQTAGDRHAYASFIVASLGGVRQLVGYDRSSLGGWDIATGRRLWTLKPPQKGDFNVPTPVAAGGQLLAATENNAARLYGFTREGQIVSTPAAVNKELAPEISTPVVVGNRAFCVSEHFYCLDISNGLRPIWIGDDKALGDYAPLVASADRILTEGYGGELILIDPAADEFKVISRLQVFADPKASQSQLLSHPALVGTRIYLRGEKELVCVDLDPHAHPAAD